MYLNYKQYDARFILEGAFQLVIKKGFSSVTARGIAKELSISTQPVYIQFENMNELKVELKKYIFKYIKYTYFSEIAENKNSFFSKYYDFTINDKKLFVSINTDRELVKDFNDFLYKMFCEIPEIKKISNIQKKQLIYARYTGVVTSLIYINSEVTYQELIACV
ncbi:hypothetical protein RV11_GL002259 [Enterococcus phoeniculicola]|jgi:AcrR family transcriptional regulator|nr:hypothetical protein RV11_GL002259 [Enterococcus phoeniculicola]